MGEPTDFGKEFLKEMMNIAATSAANTLSVLLDEHVDVALPEVIVSPNAELIRPEGLDTPPFAWHITWMSGPMLAATISIADSSSEDALARMLPAGKRVSERAPKGASDDRSVPGEVARFSGLAAPLIDSQQRSVGELTDDVLQRENDESGRGEFSVLWERLHSHDELTPEKSVAARSRLSWQAGEIHMIIFIRPSSAIDMLADSALDRALGGSD